MANTRQYDPQLDQAVLALASRCNYASTWDGQGFNKPDSRWGHDMADLIEAGRAMSPKQAAITHRMIQKYKVQLSRYGIDYDSIAKPVVPVDGNGHKPGQTVGSTTGPQDPAPVAPPVAPKQPCLMSAVQINGRDYVAVTFAFNPDLVAAVKGLPGRQWCRAGDPVDRRWTVPLDSSTADKLVQFADTQGFDIDQSLQDRLQALAADRAQSIQASRALDSDVVIQGLGKTLRPFQRAGVAYAAAKQRTFIGDEMGLGKTPQALATVQYLGAYPTLVVCKATGKITWPREVAMWLPGRTWAVLNGQSTGTDWTQADVVIINYAVLGKWINKLLTRRWAAIIIDESQRIKNRDAQRTVHCRTLATGIKPVRGTKGTKMADPIPVRLLLTGTPVINRPNELITQLQVMDRLNDLGGFWHFVRRYCDYHETTWGPDMSGASNLTELHEKLRACCYIRRTKLDVLPELPPIQRSVQPVQITNRDQYDAADMDLTDWITGQVMADQDLMGQIQGLSDDQAADIIQAAIWAKMDAAGRAATLTKINALRRIVAAGKMDAVKAWVQDFMESGEKVILFAWHQDVVQQLAQMLDAPTIAGGDSTAKRTAAIDRFMQDPTCQAIVCNIDAAGEGVTLTAATNVVFVELPWTPGQLAQAEARAYGRLNDPHGVNAWFLMAPDTIDDDMVAMIVEKGDVVSAVADGKVSGDDDQSPMRHYLQGKILGRILKLRDTGKDQGQYWSKRQIQQMEQGGI